MTLILRERKAGAANNSVLPTTLTPSPASALRSPLGNANPAACLSEQQPEPLTGGRPPGPGHTPFTFCDRFFQVATSPAHQGHRGFSRKHPKLAEGPGRWTRGRSSWTKPRCVDRGPRLVLHSPWEKSLGRRACRHPGPGRLPQAALGRRGAVGASDPQTGPAQLSVSWEGQSSPLPEPTSRVTWRALYVCAKGW